MGLKRALNINHRPIFYYTASNFLPAVQHAFENGIQKRRECHRPQAATVSKSHSEHKHGLLEVSRQILPKGELCEIQMVCVAFNISIARKYVSKCCRSRLVFKYKFCVYNFIDNCFLLRALHTEYILVVFVF